MYRELAGFAKDASSAIGIVNGGGHGLLAENGQNREQRAQSSIRVQEVGLSKITASTIFSPPAAYGSRQKSRLQEQLVAA